MDLEEAILGEKRMSADKELEELLKETEPKKVPLVDREWREVDRKHLDDLAKEISLRPLKIDEKRAKTTAIYQGDFGEIKAAVRIDEGLHGTVLVKCECSDKSDCAHILALWAAIAEKAEKPKVEKKEEKKEEKEVKNEDKGDKPKKVEVQAAKAPDDKVQPKAEAKAKSPIEKFASEIRGKLVVLFGEPYVGKTTLVHAVAKHFERVIYFKVDKNFNIGDFPKDNIYYIEVNAPWELLRELKNLNQKPPAPNSLIVVDSVTSLDAFFIPSDPTQPSPRLENARAKFADAVMQRLSYLKPNTVMVLAHEKIRDFRTGEVGPRFNVVALRHADLMYHLVIENGKRKVKKVRERRVVKEPQFEFE
jgi:hypothetical protein